MKEFLFKKGNRFWWTSFLMWVGWPLLIWATVVLFFTSCNTPKVIEQHHHHYQQTDTAAIEARIDRSTKSWRNEMDSAFRAFENKYTASWTANESEKEIITETMTTWIDSLGREVRQEQRVTNRDISKQQQMTEERITREYEARLRVVVDSVSNLWSMRYDSLAAHVATLDSLSSITHQPSPIDTGTRWYQRWWRKIKDHLLTICIVLILVNTCPLWLPWIKKLFSKIIPGL